MSLIENQLVQILQQLKKRYTISNLGGKYFKAILVTITLMIAESKAQEKDIIVKVLVNLINRDN